MVNLHCHAELFLTTPETYEPRKNPSACFKAQSPYSNTKPDWKSGLQASSQSLDAVGVAEWFRKSTPSNPRGIVLRCLVDS